MKKMMKVLTLRVLAVALATVVAGSTFAAGIGDLKVKPVSGSKKAIVSIQNLKGEEFNVSVSNSNGWVTYYEENSENNKYGKVYDLTNLENGSYVISFDNKYQIIEKVIEIDNNEISVVKETKYLKPTFKVDEDVVSFSYFNMNDNEIDVLIYDESGNTLFEETSKVSKDVLQKSFSTEKLPLGEYTLKLKTARNSFSFDFKK